jgi:ureidomalonase
VTEIVEHDAVELAALVAAREVSCVEVVAAHLEQIERLDPHVNAIPVRRDPEQVLVEARERDCEEPRGPLHGLPVAVKELAEVAGLPWTAGSPIHRDRLGAVDALHVSRMRAAGAVVVGKTNVPEFGFGSQTYNPVFGVTRNPYDPSRTPGGSSGGAAAALALRMVPLADGSDYGGSLRNPAAFCNVLGLRPSRGTVPSPGFAAQLGEVGPMARTVDDLALLLDVMAGPDPGAPLGRPVPSPPVPDVRGARIAWVGDWGGRLPVEPGLLDVCRRAADVLTGLGATVEEHLPDADPEDLWRTFLTWRWWGAAELHPLLADPRTRAQLKPEAVWEIEHAAALPALDVHRAVVARDAWYAVVRDLFGRVDAVLAPSAQVFPFAADVHWPAEVDGRPMDTYHRWMQVVTPWSLAAVPVLGMPAGFDGRGLPAGVQLIGPPGGDRAVLHLGRAYEDATGWVRRVRPALLDGVRPAGPPGTPPRPGR